MIDLHEAGGALADALDREPLPVEFISRRARSARRRRTVRTAAAVTVVVALIGGLVYRQTRSDSSLVIEPATAPQTANTVPKTTSTDAIRAGQRFITAHGGRVLTIPEPEIAAAVFDGGGNSIYVLDPSGTRLRKVSIVDLKTEASVTTPPLSSLVAHVATPLYATGTLDGSDATAFVERIEPFTLRPTWRVTTGARPVIAATDNLLWVQSATTLQRLDPNSGTVMATVELTGSRRTVALVANLVYGDRLYTARTPSGGGVSTIETRDADTGSIVATTGGPTGIGAPQLAATPDGLWTAISGGNFVTMSYFRGSPLRHILDTGEIGANGTRITYEPTLLPVLWLDVVSAPHAIACRDPETGATIATITDPTEPHLLAVNQASALVGAGGAAGFFRAHDLCPSVGP
jgi:hypothetical protein